ASVVDVDNENDKKEKEELRSYLESISESQVTEERLLAYNEKAQKHFYYVALPAHFAAMDREREEFDKQQNGEESP
ncbi:unnamed protein product, partial [Cladocopium goreaui]